MAPPKLCKRDGCNENVAEVSGLGNSKVFDFEMVSRAFSTTINPRKQEADRDKLFSLSFSNLSFSFFFFVSLL